MFTGKVPVNSQAALTTPDNNHNQTSTKMQENVTPGIPVSAKEVDPLKQELKVIGQEIAASNRNGVKANITEISGETVDIPNNMDNFWAVNPMAKTSEFELPNQLNYSEKNTEQTDKVKQALDATANTTPTSLQANEQQRVKVTGHWIGSNPILPTDSMPEDQRTYLMNTNMNMSHQSMEQFARRAANFTKNLPAERQILSQTQQHIQDHTSSDFQQSSHMVHTQRGDFWARRQEQRKQLSGVEYDSQVAADLNIAIKTRRREVIGHRHYDSLMDLMINSKRGPLTMEQSQLGIEAAAVGDKVLSQQRNKESDNLYKQVRVSHAGREGHPIQGNTPVDLSADEASQRREQEGHTVFSGTSGTASTIVCSHNAATMNVQARLSSTTQFEAPGLTDEKANMAIFNRVLNWMRSGGVAKNISEGIDSKLNSLGQRISKGPLDSTQTHSSSEIYDAVIETRKALEVLKKAYNPKKNNVGEL